MSEEEQEQEEVHTPTSQYSDTAEQLPEQTEQTEQTEQPEQPEEPPLPAAVETNDDIPTQSPLESPAAANDNSEPVAPLPGLVFIIGAMEKLLGTREGKRREGKAALEKALGVLGPKSQVQRSQEDTWLSRADVDSVIEALDVVCRSALGSSSSTTTLVVALDCVEKLVSFHYFDHISDLPTAASVAQRLKSNRSGDDDDGDDDEHLMREAI
ncbi:hypothetical protein IWW38_003810, partial [Coemansia aciculifera]